MPYKSIHDIITDEEKVIDAMIRFARDHIDPEWYGSLNKQITNGQTIYYCYRGKDTSPRKKYIGSDSSDRYEKFMANKILSDQIGRLEQTKDAMQRAGRSIPKFEGARIKISDFVQFKTSSNDERAKNIRKWMETPFERNAAEFGDAVVRTSDNTRARSKDECMEYNLFKDMGLPFRYDSLLRLKSEEGEPVTISPDFVFRCFDGSEIILEHLGMLDKEGYSINAGRKLHLYSINGFELGNNLFLTAGTKHGGVNYTQIQEVARQIEMRIWHSYDA